MPLIEFPDVPDVAGVPAILRSISVPTPGAVLDSLIGSVSDAVFARPVWGVFDEDGNEVLLPDSFLGIEYRNEARVSNYPQEKGAFASYNKVETPYDCRVKMAIGGEKADRTAFLDTLEALRKGLDLLTVVTPEVSYASANLQSYNYSRTTTNGVSMLTVELNFIEVRITAAAEFSQIEEPQEPAAADPVSDGQVQAMPVSQSTVTAVDLPPLSSGGATGSW